MSLGIFLSAILIIFMIFYIFNILSQSKTKFKAKKEDFSNSMLPKSESIFSQEEDNQQAEENTNAIIFLFDQLPNIDETEIVLKISEIESFEGGITIKNVAKKGSPEQETGWAFIEFADHKLQLFGLDMPVPETTIQNTIYPSAWGKEQTDPMRKHAANVICFYKGDNPDPVEQIIALYKVASYFTDKGLLGVLDETAWNCMPGSMVEAMFEPEMLASCRQDIPLEFWTNLVKFSRANGGVWLCTKGNNRFGVKDFAYLGTVEDIKETRELFYKLFQYSRERGISFNPGETAQIGERLALRFSTPIEYQEYLESPLGTLVVQKIDLP